MSENEGNSFPERMGYRATFEASRLESGFLSFGLGRVLVEHRDRYLVACEEGETEAEVTGNLRFTAGDRLDFPVVGDWVALTSFGQGSAVIHGVLRRDSLLSRKHSGTGQVIQAIAANVDEAFLVQSVDRDFNLNRLERYLTICHSGRVTPRILLTKCDLITSDRLQAMILEISERHPAIGVDAISSLTGDGLEPLYTKLEKGTTYCLLGSSGVGKSTLINQLVGQSLMQTKEISSHTGKGQHTTSHRELVRLPNGALLIDNPGMREIGMTETSMALDTTFDQIKKWANDCKYGDCSHTGEKGCAVAKAVERGDLSEAAYLNYRKLSREATRFEASHAERRKKERDFGRMVHHYFKERGKEND
ncbi:MAG: ribosome small subunit-dependent GTPase A [Marinilabiliales bacterium]|nr:ribosome small subunit-dependent GTPase A [Marinilabiliales bacterium]